MLKFSLLVIRFSFLFLNVWAKIECGYKQCPDTREGALNVHIIPHSHMDAGWVKTFDEYYYGTKSSVSTANVQLIYHSVLSELLHDKRRTFTFSETGYFWRWWKNQRPATRSTFRTLVQEGQIEFAGGGWVQNDEATVDYVHIIDQFTWGLRKLNDTLGPCGKPKAAWQVDTYGHSREQASLLAQMGYDGLFIGRVDHKEREAMMDEDRMEYMWRGSDILGKMTDLMTHTLFNLYNPPEGFCFDFLCSEEPIVDSTESRAYNADKKVNDFIAHVERQAKYYNLENIVVTMGGDFTYQSAANWFVNLDKLINHINSHLGNSTDINIFYSTPSCYLKAVYLFGKRDKTLYSKKDDHFPYGSDSLSYWTGFYTSRPSFKYLVKRAHAFLQVLKQLSVIAKVIDSYEIHYLRHAVSLTFHHDAITGTSQHHVMNDFIRTLSEAIDAGAKKASYILGLLTPSWGNRRSKKAQFVVCHQLNISQCTFTETEESYILLVYNPLSVKTRYQVRLPATGIHYSIRDANDEEMVYQLVPLPAAIINLPGRSSTAIQEIYFEAENIPPLGYASYYVSVVRDHADENLYQRQFVKPNHDEAKDDGFLQISNEYLKVTIDKTTGLLVCIEQIDGIKIQVTQNFFVYNQTTYSLQSGAYSFRPDYNKPLIKYPVTDRASYQLSSGPIVKEIRQRFTDWISQVIRLYHDEDFVELEWVVGPVPVGGDLNKEVVSIFSTNITNMGEFYTDSNSRQMMRRTCFNDTEPPRQRKSVSACYYPVGSRICIHSNSTSVEMCVLTDRSQGGTSYGDGDIELMVHRRLLTDDGFGLEESLNEEAYGVGLVVKGKHRILFGNFKEEVNGQSFSEYTSQASRRWNMEPWLFFTSAGKINRRKWMNVRNKMFSVLLPRGLPRHVHILTLEPWKAASVLLRLENTLEGTVRGYQEDQQDIRATTSHITVDLRKVFHHQIRLVRETTLAANQWLDDARQMDWSTRYVYDGGDDGILPDDINYTEEKTMKQELKDIPGSGDTYKRTKPRRRVKKERERVRIVGAPFPQFRRKRFIPTIISNETLEEFKQKDAADANKMKNKYLFNGSSFKTVNIALKKTPKLFMTEKSKKSLVLLDLNEKDSDNVSVFDKNKQIGEDIEEFNDEAIISTDDGVTRSILDMYYRNDKHKAVKDNKRKSKSRERDQLMSKGYKANSTLSTAHVKREKCNDKSNEDCDESEEDDDDETEIRRLKRDGRNTREHVRNPRLSNEEAEPLEEYIITLRPTQIRTFIVWFEGTKMKTEPL